MPSKSVYVITAPIFEVDAEAVIALLSNEPVAETLCEIVLPNTNKPTSLFDIINHTKSY